MRSRSVASSPARRWQAASCAARRLSGRFRSRMLSVVPRKGDRGRERPADRLGGRRESSDAYGCAWRQRDRASQGRGSPDAQVDSPGQRPNIAPPRDPSCGARRPRLQLLECLSGSYRREECPQRDCGLQSVIRDRPAHREDAGNLSHGVVAVDDDRAADLTHRPGPAARVHAFARELCDVVRNPKHPVGTNTAKVRLHRRVREQGSASIGHAASGEDGRDLAPQPVRFDASLAFRSGALRDRFLPRLCSRARMSHEGGGLRIGCPEPWLRAFAIDMRTPSLTRTRTITDRGRHTPMWDSDRSCDSAPGCFLSKRAR